MSTSLGTVQSPKGMSAHKHCAALIMTIQLKQYKPLTVDVFLDDALEPSILDVAKHIDNKMEFNSL